MIQTTVESLRELEDAFATNLAGVDACFRGQSSSAWDLIPTAYRALVPFSNITGFDPTEAAIVERDTYREFEMEAGNALRSLDIFERISVAQHHGVPTRFLDWTFNLTVATYFAVFGEETGDAAVWGLNLSHFPFHPELGRQHRGGGYTLEKIREYGRGVVASFAQPVSRSILPSGLSAATVPPASSPAGTFVLSKPKRVDERLSRQEGLLSWYHSFEDDDIIWNYSRHIVQIETQSGLDLLVKLTIPSSRRSAFQDELLKRGINDHFLFADLDGLGKYLARKHQSEIAHYIGP